MRKNKQLILNEGNLFLEQNNIQVYRESNNTYYFESQTPNLNYFFTCDYLESVSALMKIKGTQEIDQLWGIKITEDMRNIANYGSSLYWLTGGDDAWSKYKVYNIRWDEAIDLFIEEYEDILIKINNESETLDDVKIELNKHLNLPILYEFSMEKGIIN
tara:strand:+ start:4983 stop:5459 length:477 start_codon:yes stop_codon:yes gene_type:complete